MAFRYKILLGTFVLSIFSHCAIAQESISTYKVKKRETIQSISQKFGMDNDELLKYNPNFKGRDVSPKDILIIPSQSTLKADRQVAAKAAEITFTSHTVAPKETIYGISHRWGISQDELKKYNPSLETALPKIGMALKIPIRGGKIPSPKKIVEQAKPNKPSPTQVVKDTHSSAPLSREHIGASEILTQRSLNIDILLPFYLNYTDSLALATSKVKLERPKIALSFYMGVRMALDSLDRQGLKANVRVFDTQRDIPTLEDIVSKNNFSNTDLIIGPLYSEEVDFLSNKLSDKRAIIVSPLSVKHNVETQPNILQATPSPADMQSAILSEMKSLLTPTTNIIILASATQNDTQITQIKRSLSEKFINEHITFINTDLGENALRLAAQISSSSPTAILIPMLNSSYMGEILSATKESSRVSKLDVFSFEIGSKAKTMISQIDYQIADKVNFVYCEKYRDDKSDPRYTAFVRDFKAKYGEEPNTYSAQGFDTTYELLKSMSMNKNTETALTSDPIIGVTNLYLFKKFTDGGYFNTLPFVFSNSPSTGERALNY